MADTSLAALKALFGGSCAKRDEAAIIASLDELRARIGASLDLNQPLTATGSTALHAACWFRRPTVVRWLLMHGARVDVATSKGNTPMHFVCEHAEKVGAEAVFSLLLAAGSSATTSGGSAGIDIDDEVIDAPLAKCPSTEARARFERLVAVHVQRAFRLDDMAVAAIAPPPPAGASASESASSSSSLSLLPPAPLKNDSKALLRAEQCFAKLKASAERIDSLVAQLAASTSTSALAAAAATDAEEREFIALLLDAEPLISGGVLSVNRECTSDQSTLLHLAARASRVRCVAALLSCGADCNATNAQRRTPLHAAVLQMDVRHADESNIDNAWTRAQRVLAMLLAHGGDIRGAADVQGRVPLELAPSAEARAHLAATPASGAASQWRASVGVALRTALERAAGADFGDDALRGGGITASASGSAAVTVIGGAAVMAMSSDDGSGSVISSALSQFDALAAELARANVDADRQRAADAADLRAKLAQQRTGGKRTKGDGGGTLLGAGRAAASLLENLEMQAQAAEAAAGDERARADSDLRAKMAARKEREATRAAAALDIDLDVHEFGALFDQLDVWSERGVLPNESRFGIGVPGASSHQRTTALPHVPRDALDMHQIARFHRAQHHCCVADKWVALALQPSAGSEGLVPRAHFFRALSAVHVMCARVANAWWDFRLLDAECCGSLTLNAAAAVWELNRQPATIKFADFCRQRQAKEKSALNESDRISWAEIEEHLLSRAPSVIK